MVEFFNTLAFWLNVYGYGAMISVVVLIISYGLRLGNNKGYPDAANAFWYSAIWPFYYTYVVADWAMHCISKIVSNRRRSKRG